MLASAMHPTDELNLRDDHLYQGRIEPPKAARGHATSYSARIDGIVLSVRYRNAIQAISSPSTSSPASSPTSVAGQDSEKVSPDAAFKFANNIRRSRQQHNGCCVSWREGMIASKGAHAR